MQAWLGLGSNLQKPLTQLSLAVKLLADAECIELLKTSSFYRTPPWGDELQDHFINAVVKIQTDLAPLALLRQLQSIEDQMGRQRSNRRWGPRIIDIDMLLYNDQVLHLPGLDIPHTRMHERAFVLLPLSELEPAAEIPGHGSIVSLLSQLDCSEISRLSPGDQF
jgi:2-amino-4-hydroxy-6-hydroxymethyldihydropteridine diphosphokinase